MEEIKIFERITNSFSILEVLILSPGIIQQLLQ
jgi:hypothetical protein